MRSVSNFTTPLKITLITCVDLFGPFLHSWRLLWNLCCLWSVSSGPWRTLTFEESRTHWVSPKTFKKVCQDGRLLWKSPFLPFWPFFLAAFYFHCSLFEVFIVSDMFHKLPIHLRSMSLYHNLEKSVSRLLSLLKINHLAMQFWIILTVPW